MATVTRAGGAAVAWLPVANLGTGITLLGAPFLAVSGSPAGGTRVFDIPVGVTAPTAVRRLNVQGAGADTVGLNFNTDRTITLAAAAPGTFLILDGCTIPSWP